MAEEIDLNNPPFPLTAIDRELLATKDVDFHRTTWDDLGKIIENNTLESLKRLPSDLRKYLAWSHNIRSQYGSIVAYVLQERLRWTPIHPPPAAPTFPHHSPIPFHNPRDFAVLRNDWPYGFTPDITHLLVWTKTPIATDDQRGDVTEESRRVIEAFVDTYFVQDLVRDMGLRESEARGRVLWFKNWVSLQSVRGVDHVHVLVRHVPDQIIERWTTRKDL